MEAKEHILAFFDAIKDDGRFSVYHISLYIAIMHYQIERNWQNPVSIHREQVVAKTRMCRRKFNRCMKELVEFGYFKYEPSLRPGHPGKVYVKRL
ncbi:MAG: hypothetical protein V4539_16980 [Bacteroidota bacterium]